VRRDDAVVRFLGDAIERAGDGLPRFGKLDRRALRALARDLWPELRPLIAELVREVQALKAAPPLEYLAPLRERASTTTTPSEEATRVARVKPIREVTRGTTDMRARVSDVRDARALRVPDVPASVPDLTRETQATPEAAAAQAWTLDAQRDALDRLVAVVARRGAEIWTLAVERNALERVERITASANDGRSVEFAVQRDALDRIGGVTASMADGLWTLALERADGKLAGVRVTRPDGTTQEVANVGA
jgi:hypothetical protein